MSKYRIISHINKSGIERYYIEEKVKCFFRDKWVSVDIADMYYGASTLQEAQISLKRHIELKTKLENFKPEIHEYNPGDL